MILCVRNWFSCYCSTVPFFLFSFAFPWFASHSFGLYPGSRFRQLKHLVRNDMNFVSPFGQSSFDRWVLCNKLEWLVWSDQCEHLKELTEIEIKTLNIIWLIDERKVAKPFYHLSIILFFHFFWVPPFLYVFCILCDNFFTATGIQRNGQCKPYCEPNIPLVLLLQQLIESQLNVCFYVVQLLRIVSITGDGKKKMHLDVVS